MHAQEISASRFVELCLVLVVSEKIILLHTHTLLSDQPFLIAVPVYRNAPSFPVYIYVEESRIYTHFLCQGKSN